MSTPTTFDPIQFKETTRAQWQKAAEAWNAWGSTLSTWLGPATERMLDLARVGPGSHVLDVAAGAGEQTLTTALRVGPEGRVLATDLAPNILEFAARAAREAGLNQVETRAIDGERLDELPAETFDAAISRVGLIYFPDQQRALAGVRHALKPGGRFATITYSTAERNGFFSLPVSIIRERAQLPPPLPGQPGPFSLGTPEVLRSTLERAGFREIEVEVVEAPLRLASRKDCVRFERESFGALHQMLGGLSEQAQAEVWQEIEEALRRFETDGGFVGPCELVLGSGVK
ncbi:MAG: methyltransferase domain-containing protein [Planctomycetota bacterium]